MTLPTELNTTLFLLIDERYKFDYDRNFILSVAKGKSRTSLTLWCHDETAFAFCIGVLRGRGYSNVSTRKSSADTSSHCRMKNELGSIHLRMKRRHHVVNFDYVTYDPQIKLLRRGIIAYTYECKELHEYANKVCRIMTEFPFTTDPKKRLEKYSSLFYYIKNGWTILDPSGNEIKFVDGEGKNVSKVDDSWVLTSVKIVDQVRMDFMQEFETLIFKYKGIIPTSAV